MHQQRCVSQVLHMHLLFLKLLVCVLHILLRS